MAGVDEQTEAAEEREGGERLRNEGRVTEKGLGGWRVL